MKNYTGLTQQKIAQIREIEEFNARAEPIGFEKIAVDDVSQRGNQINADFLQRQNQNSDWLHQQN